MRRMAAPQPWTYSNWRTAGPIGSQARVLALANHCQEVADRISEVQQYAIKGREVGPPVPTLQTYLKSLDELYERESERADLTSGTRVGWTQAFAKLTPGTVPGGGTGGQESNS